MYGDILKSGLPSFLRQGMSSVASVSLNLNAGALRRPGGGRHGDRDQGVYLHHVRRHRLRPGVSACSRLQLRCGAAGPGAGEREVLHEVLHLGADCGGRHWVSFRTPSDPLLPGGHGGDRHQGPRLSGSSVSAFPWGRCWSFPTIPFKRRGCWWPSPACRRGGGGSLFPPSSPPPVLVLLAGWTHRGGGSSPPSSPAGVEPPPPALSFAGGGGPAPRNAEDVEIGMPPDRWACCLLVRGSKKGNQNLRKKVKIVVDKMERL